MPPEREPGKVRRRRRKDQTPMEEATELARANLAHLRALMGTVEATLASGELTPALARESAGLSRAITAVMAELRQQEKHHRTMVDRLTPEERLRLVIEFVRNEATAEMRVEFRRMLDDLDSAEHILS